MDAIFAPGLRALGGCSAALHPGVPPAPPSPLQPLWSHTRMLTVSPAPQSPLVALSHKTKCPPCIRARAWGFCCMAIPCVCCGYVRGKIFLAINGFSSSLAARMTMTETDFRQTMKGQMMKTFPASRVNQEVSHGRYAAYTWTDCGDGYFARVTSYNEETGWLRCAAGNSFLVCPDTKCFSFVDGIELEQEQKRRQANLRQWRADMADAQCRRLDSSRA